MIYQISCQHNYETLNNGNYETSNHGKRQKQIQNVLFTTFNFIGKWNRPLSLLPVLY